MAAEARGEGQSWKRRACSDVKSIKISLSLSVELAD